MLANNTTENVFRFLQLRPAQAPDPDDPYPSFRLTATPFARDLASATDRERMQAANRALQTPGGAGEIVRSDPARRLLDAVRETLAYGDTVAELRAKIGGATPSEAGDYQSSWSGIHDAASDLLVAAKFSTTAGTYSVCDLDRLFRAARALLTSEVSASTKLEALFRRPLALPDDFRSRVGPAPRAARTPPGVPRGSSAPSPRDAMSRAARLTRALDELAALIRPELLVLVDPDADRTQSGGAPPFALNANGLARLSPETQTVLADLGLRPDAERVENLVHALETEIARTVSSVAPGVVLFAPQTEGEEEPRPYIRDVGVADLLVVKQHLKRYDRVDIAHVENVLQGEKKSRTHRTLERTEETLTTERETIQERETELETAERFEMNRETARTVSRDQQFGFGLTLSGKYGPAVEFTSTLQGDISTSTQDSVTSATTYAKDIVERSLERVVERIREEHVRVVIREQEETNLHELDNQTNAQISGVYQFIEKVLESQIFNYGIRQMFDFMIPEPASYLWYLEQSDTELNVPTPPPTLESLVPNAGAINAGNYLAFAAQFGADAVESPPEMFVTVGASLSHGAEAKSDSEEDQPRSVVEKDLSVPAGYRPYRALLRPLALTDEALTLGIVVGHARRVWKPSGADVINVGSDHKLASASLDVNLLANSHPFESQGKVGVQVVAFETNTYSLAAEVVFVRLPATYTAWQIRTYDKLATANRDRVQKYEQQVEELRARAEAQAAREGVTRFGSAPSQNLKTAKGELKKHCISIVTRQRYDEFDAVQDGDPPFFNFIEAAEEGTYIRFFEQAFEWDQMQYVFYPYFWARKTTWGERFLRREVDFEFQEFLQSGSARVVVPVRPGFEVALAHYLETGNIWNGDGELPPINSPLYVPIITEIQERTGASQGEIPVGEPWPTHVPTPLVILRSESGLPTWRRLSADGWEWEEVEETT